MFGKLVMEIVYRVGQKREKKCGKKELKRFRQFWSLEYSAAFVSRGLLLTKLVG